MWFIGLIVGAILGAGMHGFDGAMWGAIIGWLIGLVLGRSSSLAKRAKSDEKIDKFEQLEQRVAHAQKAVEDIHWRLNQLEEKSGLAISPMTVVVARPLVQASAQPDDHKEDAPASRAAAHPIEHVTTATAEETPFALQPRSPEPISFEPQVPGVPGFIERMLEANIVAKLGVVVLFFGVGFLLKFAYDRGVFPPEMRLLGVAAASAVMFYIGLKVFDAKRTYALILFGGAMGLMYLDIFFALKTFALISAAVGFVLFAALGISTIVLAVRLDARAFAALGLLGAFMAPILASTGSGNHVLLFSYYLLLNLVIVGASWFKAWRELNFIGFLFTFAIALIWGYATYQPEHFVTVEPFLILFFLLYLAIPILFAQRQPPQLKGLVDGTLVFGMPLSAAMLQAALTRGLGENVLAWSAFCAAVVYAALAWLLWKREKMRQLAEAHLALALVFGTAAPYFAFQGYPTFAFWTLEGAAIFWMGCRQKSVLSRAFALCLQVVAAGYFWWLTHDLSISNSADPWWNDWVIGCVLIAAASLLTAWFMHRFKDALSNLEAGAQGWLVAWGTCWLFAGIICGICRQWTAAPDRLSAMLIVAALVVTMFEWIGGRLAWTALRRTQILLTAVMLASVIYMSDHRLHPFAGGQFFAWLAAFIVGDFVLARQERDDNAWRPAWQHVVLFNLALVLAVWEVCWRANDLGLSSAWKYAGIGFTLAFGIAAALFAIKRNVWPFGPHAAAIRNWSMKPLLAGALLWTLLANIDSSGSIDPLPYLPILNPLDLAQLALFAAAIWALRGLQENKSTGQAYSPMLLTIAAAGFFWANAALLRAVHHWTDVPFELSALLHSVVAQAALSLLWTLTAMALMWSAGKRSPPSRGVWMAGAVLLGIVVLKLFANDLGNTGTVARIVSFIGVGVLLMVIGYVAPVPPNEQRAKQ